MKTNSNKWFASDTLTKLTLVATGILLVATNLSAATRYVWQDSSSPAPPYTNWTTAAHVFQDAVDAALAGDEIVVTNGTYASGGRAIYGTMTNRVAVDKPLTVRSVNGPQFTVIQGYQIPGTTNGDGAIRCVYLTNGASLSGFTLTNGATRTAGDVVREKRGGGIWCETSAMASNCVLAANAAAQFGGGAYQGTFNHCTFTGNSSPLGGGAYGGTLNNCTLTGNSATGGGGAYGATINNCTLTGNSANNDGGGVSGGTLNNCMLTANSARYGGAASGGTLNNCTLAGNSADEGGGARGSALNNCTLTGNKAPSGGGVSSSTLTNCTLTGNSALWSWSAGGAYNTTLKNCILYYNSGGSTPNYSGGSLTYCCTTPLRGGDNLSSEPQLASVSHLSASSPCRGAGSAAYAKGLDIDGEAWLNPPSIGCDEYRVGSLTGDLTVAIGASWTYGAVGVPVDLTGRINGRVSASAWDFGDGASLSNRPFASHAWGAVGDYTVVLRAYNESHPAGVSATVTIRVVANPVQYVSAASASPVPPYSSWATAARTIQEAVDMAAPGGEVVVSNGVYATGGRVVWGSLTNRVAVTKSLVVRSVNGPEVTVIQGYQMPGTKNGATAIRCVYLADGAVLSGFTLTNGATRTFLGYASEDSRGGGVLCESTNALVLNCTLTGNTASVEGGGAYSGTLNNCTLVGNSTTLRYGTGGGANSSTLNNCVLAGNSSASDGGGASGGMLNNCTLTSNSANSGGGASGATLNNCILYYNTANVDPNYHDYYGTNLNHCCTTPLPGGGAGNLSDEPQLASASHLSASSPCRGAGSAVYATGLDIDGEPWLSPPSIGCDEYQADALTGDLAVAIGVSWTNVAVGFAADFTACISGQVAASAWDFGDGTILSNRPCATHAWAAAGDYSVVLRAYNDSHPAGISATVMVHVVTQPVHYVALGSLAPQAPYDSWGTAARNIQTAVDAALVPGALVLVTNGVYASGGRAAYGTMTNRVAVDKPLVVRSVNGPLVTVIQGYRDGAIRCVYLIDGAVLSGFTLTNGATLNSGDDQLEQSGGGVWCESAKALATNCTLTANSAYYSGGGVYRGTLNNCTLTGNTAQNGGGASYSTLINCSLTANSAPEGGGVYEGTLHDCTLTGNSAAGGGGAVWGTLNNCVLSSNSARNGGGALNATLNDCTLTENSATGDYGYGGGSYQGTLNHCLLTANSASQLGGGAFSGTLNNCTLTGNSAVLYGGGGFDSTLNSCTLTGNSATGGGGAWGCTLNNCIAYYNSAGSYSNYYDYYGADLNYCCTTPQHTNGVGNITNAPLFVDYAGGDLRLQSNSPCINAGLNAYATGPTDLAGNPRIVSGTVDVGAYEFQGPGSVISYAWLQHYGLPTDGSADATDSDADGHTTWQEWRCQTCPTNALSSLCLMTPSLVGSNLTVSWQSVAGVNYFLERSTNLSPAPLFKPLITGIPGQPGSTTYTDTNALGVGPFFYRVGVGPY